jgi:hypothetical protein
MLDDYINLLMLMTADPEKNLATISQAGAAAIANIEF